MKVPVAVLGATGTVGQRFLVRLADHPWFEVAALAASAAGAGSRQCRCPTRGATPLAQRPDPQPMSKPSAPAGKASNGKIAK